MVNITDLTQDQIRMYNTAHKLYRQKLMTEREFVKYCKANGININDNDVWDQN